MSEDKDRIVDRKAQMPRSTLEETNGIFGSWLNSQSEYGTRTKEGVKTEETAVSVEDPIEPNSGELKGQRPGLGARLKNIFRRT